MSGFTPVHGHRFHFVKAQATYTPHRIQKESRIRFDVALWPPDADVKFGMKILQTQSVTEFLLNPGPRQVDVWNTCRSQPVTTELATAFRQETLPTEKWEGFLLPSSQLPPSPQQDTRLVIENFDLARPDFQEVPFVFTLVTTPGGFGSGHYVIGSSVLVGQ